MTSQNKQTSHFRGTAGGGDMKPNEEQGMRLYKFLHEDGRCCNGGQGSWYLPKGKRPGKWMPPIKGDLIPCEHGYHLLRLCDVLQWDKGRVLWLADARGQVLTDDEKIVASQARLFKQLPWNDKTRRLFAADCAKRVLHIFEKCRPGDQRPRQAIAVVRRFAAGEATDKEMAAARDAARAAAWAAAWDAARDAARAAARAAARDAAWAAAWDAAWAAAWAAARDAARAAAWAAARDAAWAAAWAAARDAARAAAWAAARDAAWAAARDAARDAAWAAARDAAWAAARDAARDAEREWQWLRLRQYLHGEA